MVTRIMSRVNMVFLREKLAADLRRAQEEYGLTNDDVDGMVGVHVTTSLYNKSKPNYMPTVRNLLAICNLFDLNPQQYFGLDVHAIREYQSDE